MKKSVLILVVMGCVFFIGCDHMDLSETQRLVSDEEIVMAIQNGKTYRDGSEVHVEPELKQAIAGYLLTNWQDLEAIRSSGSVVVPKKPPTETHDTPYQHFSLWHDTDELHLIYRTWETPPVVSVYKIWACFVIGCYEVELEWIHDIPQ